MCIIVKEIVTLNLGLKASNAFVLAQLRIYRVYI